MQIYASPMRQDRVRILVALFLIAAVLWLITIIWAQDMGVMPGTMGMGPASFGIMWTLMMAAMMLPSAAAMITLYTRTLAMQRYRRLALFIAGYIVAWSLSSLPAFGLAWLAGRVVESSTVWATGAAVLIFVTCGVYQLTSLKHRCLHHCRSPLSHLFQYGSYQGRLRDLRAGLHHGMFCLGCCWGLMILMVAFGVMNLVAMVLLAGVVALEKQWRHGETVAKAAGGLALILALAVIFVPDLAPGLNGAMSMTGDTMMTQP